MLLFISLLISGASAATLEVGSGYPYSSIKAALSAATSGDTILVHPGTYTDEHITFRNIHDITLQGIGYPLILDNQGSTSDTNPCVLIAENAYNITVRGFKLTHTGSLKGYHGGVRAKDYKTWGLDIEDNIINTYNGDGVWFDSAAGDAYHCNDSRIINNTIRTTGNGKGIYIPIKPNNINVSYNDIAVTDDFENLGNITSGAYGLNVIGINSTVNNNIIRSCSYSLLKTGGINVTVENNVAYGKSVHNYYELGYTSGVFKNNSLIDTNRTWMNKCKAESGTPNNFYNPGGWPNHHMVYEDVHSVNSSIGRILSVGGHSDFLTVKNTTIETNPAHLWDKIIVWSEVNSNLYLRSSNGLVFDNITLNNHTGTGNVPMWIQGVGTDHTPTAHTAGDYADLLRDNITLYDVKFPNNKFIATRGVYDGQVKSRTTELGLYYDDDDTNVSVMLANSNISAYYYGANGGIINSLEWYWFTDIDVTDNGNPAGVSRIFVETNATRPMYNESVPYFNGNYVDDTQENYSYQQTVNGGLYTPEYIETLSDGKTGTRSTPENCLLLASSTTYLTSPRSYTSIASSNVSYNISVSGGSYNSSYFYTVPTGMNDIVSVDSMGNYEHKIGTKYGSTTNYHPTPAQYKENSYARGTVDLTIPISAYDSDIIPMQVML